MTLKELAEMISSDSGPILIVVGIVMSCIQVIPTIKINPWTAVFSWLGNQLNKDVLAKIDVVEKRLDKHIEDSEEAELSSRRTSILDFGSSVIRGVNYHKEKFDFMIHECDKYEEYCVANGIKNGVAEASISEIRRIYKEHLRKDDFLVEKTPMGGDSNEKTS